MTPLPLGVNSEMPLDLTLEQQRVVAFPRRGGGALFVTGPAGSGKSTALHARLVALLCEGCRPYEILTLLPQRAQVTRYEDVLATLDAPTRGGCDIVTFYGFTRRAVALFWPLVARPAGFCWPEREPTFLTIETTQYYMWRIVEPLMAQEGYFGDLSIRRERLLSQLVDNLNKAALVGFDHTAIFSRLKGAWTGEEQRLNSYQQAQDCAARFRRLCLDQNLLDFSLLTETFTRHLLPHPLFGQYFSARYRHLLVDDLEENVPVAHAFVQWAMRQCHSTVLAYDPYGGFRVFLGADAAGAAELRQQCTDVVSLERLPDTSDAVVHFAHAIRAQLRLEAPVHCRVPPTAIADQTGQRYWISMIRWVAQTIADRVGKGVPPGQIAIIAPYVSEVMRFAIQDELERQDVPLFLLRPTTPLAQDPIIRGLLVLAVLAQPGWSLSIQERPYQLPPEDTALALQVALEGLDPIRARLLTEAAVPPGSATLQDLSVPPKSTPRLWERVGYQVRERYLALCSWLAACLDHPGEPLDVFFSRLFGELLSRPGYGFCQRPDLARAYGRLVESAFKFRMAVGSETQRNAEQTGQDYVELILGGIASASYVADWPHRAPQDAVVLAPAYSYLTRDLRSDYQFWIDLGSDGWWTRPNQPLTQPYVLSNHWEPGQPWRDIEEQQASREALGRVILGLATRCRKAVYLAYSQLGIDGGEQQGQLHRVIMTILSEAKHDV